MSNNKILASRSSSVNDSDFYIHEPINDELNDKEDKNIYQLSLAVAILILIVVICCAMVPAFMILGKNLYP
jgi:hypothetical protein